jgi:crotonobetainyl-CoA:carnitine CoA-transferase CaiB-like acyl-CoA transferase
MLALENFKIIDMTISGPGNLTTQYLADMGADVIKIVPVPGSGRANNPFTAALDEKYLATDFLNRNKRCIGINLKSPEGKEAFMKLAKTVDVVVEGGRPGAAKRLGVDYEEVKKVNTRVIYCSLSGYGQDGPYAPLPGHDVNYIGYAGMLSIVGELDGPPVIPDSYLADFAGASLHAVIGITVALLAREKTGKGQFVDVSYTDGAMAINVTILGMYLSLGFMFDRGGMPTCGAYPAYSVYQTKDGKWLTLGAYEPWFWENTCKLLGLEEYIQDGTLSLDAYMRNRPNNPKIPEIRKALEDKFKTKNRDEWVELLQKSDIPAGPVYNMEEVVNDPHLKQRMIIEVDVPGAGRVKQPGFPIKMSETPARFRKRAPGVGEHTDEILGSLGYTAAQIKKMRESRAVI